MCSLLMVFAGLIVTLVGYKLKGVSEASLALAMGVVWFLYNKGVVRF